MSCFYQTVKMMNSLGQIMFSNQASFLINFSAQICCMDFKDFFF